MLGDGGNGYALGQPMLREWMEEYRALPQAAFTARPDARDPAAVWTHSVEGRLLFYAVNRERYPVHLSIQFWGTQEVTRFATGERIPFQDSHLELDLSPYQLLAFSAPADAQIVQVREWASPADTARAQELVAWLSALATKASTAGDGSGLGGSQRKTLSDLAHKATLALQNGWLWRARTIVEDSRLLAIYSRLGTAPPALRATAGSALVAPLPSR
jgi:hypothetical protein